DPRVRLGQLPQALAIQVVPVPEPGALQQREQVRLLDDRHRVEPVATAAVLPCVAVTLQHLPDPADPRDHGVGVVPEQAEDAARGPGPGSRAAPRPGTSAGPPRTPPRRRRTTWPAPRVRRWPGCPRRPRLDHRWSSP